MQPDHTAYKITVLIWINPNQSAAFADYERAAINIMSDHRGKLIAAHSINAENSVKGVPQNNDLRPPDEIHWLEFPSENEFLQYRQDGRLLALADKRHLAIEHTVIFHGIDLTAERA